MKHIIFELDNKKKFSEAVKESLDSRYKSSLVQVFTSITKKEQLQKIIKKLNKKFINSTIIGTTTAGEISKAKMLDNSTVVSVTLFEKTKLNASYVKDINTDSGKELFHKICKKTTKAAVLLSEGLHGEDYEGFINGFRDQNPNIIVSGGLAGDNFELKETFVFLNNKLYNRGSVAVSFSSKKLYADNRYNLNWEPIGKEFVVTKADGNLVYEIDNQNSIEVFKKYLGEELFEDGAKTLPDFQLLYKEGLTIVARTPMAVGSDHIVFAAPVKEGQRVQFGFSNAPSIISGSTLISDIIDKNPADAIYIYSCIARKTLLGKKLQNEFENFESIAPSAGFFTYGEYYSTGSSHAMLNCTTTLLILSESKTTHKRKDIKTKYYNIDDITFNALTHFIKQTSQELDSNVKLLNQYKDIVDESLLISKTDLKGNITYINDNFIKVSGFSRDELIGQNHNIVRDKNVSPFVFKKMWNTIQDEKIWHGQFPNRAKDGSTYYVDATIMPTYKDGIVDGYIAMRQDITKQINAKNRLKEKEKFIKAIFDNQDSIVVLASKEDGVINVNKTFFEHFNYDNLEEFKEQHKCICELFIEEDGYLSGDNHGIWLTKVVDENNIDHKAKILSRDKNIHTFDVKVNQIDNQYVINLSDITNLENALQKAYLSEKAKSMFLANMSHEIRTPLNGILGFTDILNKKELDKESSKYVEIIDKSGKSLLNIVNDILDYSKIESGELSLYTTDSNLFSEMEAAASVFASSAKSKNIDFYTYIDTNIPRELKCDVQRVKQVVTNLISNAIKFTPNGGDVSFNMLLNEIKDGYALISFSVKDSGIGIAEDKLDSVFEAFSQADNSISRKFGGTGLGLSISSKYIEMMGNRLKVDSVEGSGSEFYFTLTLPIVDKAKSLSNKVVKKGSNIVILQSDQIVKCEINNIVTTYLDSWDFEYNIIHKLDELEDDIDIMIVCSKLFDHDSCRDALDRHEKLKLVFIEGGEDKFECKHKKFYSISQPMTGSSLFNMILDLSDKETQKLKTTTTDVNNKRYHGRVLVAEDNETNQMLIEIMLKERGLDFKIVDDGQKAVDEALENDYDIIFMDINMPVLDGVGATKKLREKNYQKPIISLSANVIESDVKSYKKAGIDASLSKPIVPEELDEMISRYIEFEEEIIIDSDENIEDEVVDLNEEEKIEFDTVDVSKITESLGMPNDNISLRLLKSFKNSASEIVKTLNSSELDENILHNIKGISGNLRFGNLYELSKKFEDSISSWSIDLQLKNKDTIIKHLNSIIDQISLIDK
jgi:PAS domain S-box-containing protein